MLKRYLMTFAIAAMIAVLFIALGSSDENPMLGFGLFLTLAAGLVTIALAINSKLAAMRVHFKPTEEPEHKKSQRFTPTPRVMGVDNQETVTSRMLQDLSASVDELELKVSSLEFDRQVLKTHLRICFDNIRYHDEITLPQALASSWGGTVLSTLVGLTGAIIAAFPQSAFRYAVAVNTWLVSYL